MRLPSLAFALICFAGASFAAPTPTTNTAMNAIRQLPRGEYKRIVRIEAREGKPAPERWYIIVHDPKDENGVHEYVIAGGEVVASRSLSQFVESVKADDIVKESMIKIDSDKVGALASEYALANNVSVATMSYSLLKDGADAAPLWSVACFDESGKQIGTVVVSAGKGNVISHEGFTAEPGAEALAKTETQSDSDSGDHKTSQKRVAVRTTPNATPSPDKGDIFSRMGNSLNKFFTGGRAH
jgi:hypothetical protein